MLKGTGNSAPHPDRDRTSELERFEVDRVLDTRLLGLRFPHRLEAQFERETGAARSRRLLFHSVLALFLYDAFMVLDYFVIHDVFWTSLAVRGGALAVIAFVIFAILWRNPPAHVRETLATGLTILASACAAFLVVLSDSPLQGEYHYGLMVILMFAVTMQRQRFVYAVATSVCVIGIHQVALAFSGDIPLVTRITASALMLCVALFGLVTAYHLERDERIAYLRGLRERLNSNRFEALSHLDALTGLGNRRGLKQLLRRLTAGRRMVAPLAVIIVDIDHFKAYNDTFGHLAGDECIKRTCRVLSTARRAHVDEIFRFGGEEFVVVMPGATMADALRAAEHMRVALEDEGIKHVVPHAGAPVTASLGVAGMAPDGEIDASQLLARADAALYAAKRAGRNRVCPPPDEEMRQESVAATA